MSSKVKGQPVKMIVEQKRRGFDLVMRRPKGAVYFEGFLAVGPNHVENVRARASQDPNIDRSLRGF